MKKIPFAKTVFVSLDRDPTGIFEWLASPNRLPEWHKTFCRSITQENQGWIVASPRGPVNIRFKRNDHARLLDLVLQPVSGTEFTTSIRVLPHGEGAEIIATLVQSLGEAD